MGNRRFSLTTYVLVGISLVALYLVGKTVTPPPPAPPKEAPAAPPVPSPSSQLRTAQMKKTEPDPRPGMPAQSEMAKQRALKMQEMAKKMKAHPAPDPNTFNPASIDTTADYWQHAKDGGEGTKEMRDKVAKALESEKKIAKALAEQKKAAEAKTPAASKP